MLNFFNTSANTSAICIHVSAAPSHQKRLISTCRSTCRMNMFFPDTPARRVIRIIRSYGLALRHPAAPARHSLQPAKPAPAPKVCQRCCPRSIADRVFFHHSHALPSILLWQQDCPFNPAVATGLLHPILPWQQDCPFNPAVATGLLHPILLWQQDCPFNPAVATGLLHPFLC